MSGREEPAVRGAVARAAGCKTLPPIVDEWTDLTDRRMHAWRIAGPAGGLGPDVVLLHGLIVSGRYMLPLAVHLASQRTVHVPDLPGIGRSRSAPMDPSIAGLADTLVAWLHARDVIRPHLVANSAGCQIAAAAAARHPGAVRSIALIGPTMDPSARHVHQQALRWLRTARHEPFALNVIIARDYLDAGPRRALAMARHALTDRIERHLPALDVPALVVRGGRDAIVSQRWAQTVAALAEAELVLIAGAHALNFSRPSALASVLHRFFATAERAHRDPPPGRRPRRSLPAVRSARP